MSIWIFLFLDYLDSNTLPLLFASYNFACVIARGHQTGGGAKGTVCLPRAERTLQKWLKLYRKHMVWAHLEDLYVGPRILCYTLGCSN